MSPVGVIADRFFAKGQLPDRVRLVGDWAPARAGSTYTWDPVERGFLSDAGAGFVFLAAFVRCRPDLFEAAPAEGDD